MNSDEPALVPQWLQKGGPPGTSGGHSYSSTSQFASRGRLCCAFNVAFLFLLAVARCERCVLNHMHACTSVPQKLFLLVDTKTRTKRDAPATGGRPGSAVTRDSTFGRPEREAPRRDRALRDSWQASPGLGSSSSSYRPAAASRGNRAPPERLASDNSRSNLDNRDTFGPSASSSSTSRGVFRTQSGPPLRDREDFGFGSSTSGYHDGLAFKPNAPRGTAVRSSLEKVTSKYTLTMHTIWSDAVHLPFRQCLQLCAPVHST